MYGVSNKQNSDGDKNIYYSLRDDDGPLLLGCSKRTN